MQELLLDIRVLAGAYSRPIPSKPSGKKDKIGVHCEKALQNFPTFNGHVAFLGQHVSPLLFFFPQAEAI